MKNWHLMIVGLLALVAAVLVGLNWTTVGGTTEMEQEQVETKAKQSAKRAEETLSTLRDEVQKRCEKFLAKRAEREVAAGEVDEADIEDVCACAADEIHYEFDLPDMIRSANGDLESDRRINEIVKECAREAGL